MYDPGETIRGIDAKERIWFQLLTLIGGIAGSIIMIRLELIYGSTTPNETVRNLLLGISASFVASGFLSWAILQTKEVIMAIADLIRARTERIRQRIREEGYQLGYRAAQEGIQEGIQEGLRRGREEGYQFGYRDAQEGKPNKPPSDSPTDTP